MAFPPKGSGEKEDKTHPNDASVKGFILRVGRQKEGSLTLCIAGGRKPDRVLCGFDCLPVNAFDLPALLASRMGRLLAPSNGEGRRLQVSLYAMLSWYRGPRSQQDGESIGVSLESSKRAKCWLCYNTKCIVFSVTGRRRVGDSTLSKIGISLASQ